MNGREIDARLAEAIGCKVGWTRERTEPACMCPSRSSNSKSYSRRPHGLSDATNLRGYYSAPTWETTGQLIDSFVKDGRWHLQMDSWQFVRFSLVDQAGRYVGEYEWIGGFGESLPKAIVEAARLALGIPAPEEDTEKPRVSR